ncbi:hypothetical protein KQR54_18160 [Mycobacterium gordonae]|nr:hypothetical protein [Mycobacterium gordonae]
MQIGRRIYYELSTGNVIVNTGERSGSVVETTQEQDFTAYAALAERVPSTVGVIELAYGQYAQDFAEATGYRVDITGAEPALEFTYPNPNEPEEPPVYRPPLSDVVAAQEARIADVELALADLFTL